MTSLPATFVPGFHDEATVRKMKYKPLGKTGLEVSSLGLGGAALGIHYGSFPEEEAIAAVRYLIRQGVNYIDTAPFYGQGHSEAVLGKALKEIPRQAYYIATKVARFEMEPAKMFDYSAEKTRWSVDHSLKLLGLDYVDIIQIHDVEFASSLDVIFNETLPALEEIVKYGKAHFIGITGYPVSVLKKVVEGSRIKISTILSYTRDTLIDNTLQQYIPFFQSHEVGVITAAGVASGLLTNAGPQPWHLASDEVKAVCADAAQYCKDRGVELGRLAIHYAFSQPGAATHLSGMNDKKIMDSNLDVLMNGLSDLEKQTLQDIKTKFFSKLKETHWEGKELAEYWREIKKLKK